MTLSVSMIEVIFPSMSFVSISKHTCQVTLDISGSPIYLRWGCWKYSWQLDRYEQGCHDLISIALMNHCQIDLLCMALHNFLYWCATKFYHSLTLTNIITALAIFHILKFRHYQVIILQNVAKVVPILSRHQLEFDGHKSLSQELTHWVTHVCVTNLGHHWFR